MAAAFVQTPPPFSEHSVDAASGEDTSASHLSPGALRERRWLPACAGMTKRVDASYCNIQK
jgi:hypothetical protein